MNIKFSDGAKITFFGLAIITIIGYFELLYFGRVYGNAPTVKFSDLENGEIIITILGYGMATCLILSILSGFLIIMWRILKTAIKIKPKNMQ